MTLSKSNTLFKTISEYIEKARKNVVKTVNSELVMLYWNIGSTIRKVILKNKRADEECIVQRLSSV